MAVNYPRLVALDTEEILREDNMTPVATPDMNEVSFEEWCVIVEFANAGPALVRALREARLTLAAHSDTQHVLRTVDEALGLLSFDAESARVQS